MKERVLVVPNTAVEVLEMLEELFVDRVEREPLASLWDYGLMAGQQQVIDYLRGVLDAEGLNEQDELSTYN